MVQINCMYMPGMMLNLADMSGSSRWFGMMTFLRA
jgi:hypothetical protein